MPVVKYKLTKNDSGQGIVSPDIRESGEMGNFLDDTYLGWVDDNPENEPWFEYEPMTKEQVADRQLEMHRIEAFAVEKAEPDGTLSWERDKTDEEVIKDAEDWYDAFIARCVIDEGDLDALKENTVKRAFNMMEKKLAETKVEVPVTGQSSNVSFGCDDRTQENIMQKLKFTEPTSEKMKWKPKGISTSVDITPTELMTPVKLSLIRRKSFTTNTSNTKTIS